MPEKIFRGFCLLFALFFFLASFAAFAIPLAAFFVLHEIPLGPVLILGLVTLLFAAGLLMRGLGVFEIHEHTLELGQKYGWGPAAFGIYLSLIGLIHVIILGYVIVKGAYALDPLYYAKLARSLLFLSLGFLGAGAKITHSQVFAHKIRP